MATHRTRLADKKSGEAQATVQSINFDAYDTLRGVYDDATVQQVVPNGGL